MCASAVLPLTQGQPVLGRAKKLRKCRKGHHPLWLQQTCELPPCQGALSYTHRTDTSVDKKPDMAFTPLVTALAPWKGPGSMEGTDSAQGSGRSVQSTVLFGGLQTSQY